MKEFLNQKEIALRLGVTRQYINNKKSMLIEAGCLHESGKLFDYEMVAKILGRDPQNPHTTPQANNQKKINESKPKILSEQSNEIVESSGEMEDLLGEILQAIKDKEITKDRAMLDGLKLKASIIKEYFAADTEKLKNYQLRETTFSNEEVIKILDFSLSVVRNKLMGMENNYAVSLEGLDKAAIRKYVRDDVNSILEEFQRVGDEFTK
jgi:predicted transcriptional regulator